MTGPLPRENDTRRPGTLAAPNDAKLIRCLILSTRSPQLMVGHLLWRRKSGRFVQIRVGPRDQGRRLWRLLQVLCLPREQHGRHCLPSNKYTRVSLTDPLTDPCNNHSDTTTLQQLQQQHYNNNNNYYDNTTTTTTTTTATTTTTTTTTVRQLQLQRQQLHSPVSGDSRQPQRLQRLQRQQRQRHLQ
jgi:hypothetical protein